MVGIDIPLPECCLECPCSYYIRTGEHAGRLMCQALEYRDKYWSKETYLVNEKVRKRPEKCPMRELGEMEAKT